MKKLLLCLVVFAPLWLSAQNDSTSLKQEDEDLFDMSLEELLNLEIVDKNFYLYGYINANLQKTFNYPAVVNGETVVASDPFEWSPVKNFHIYGQGNLTSKISYMFNLARKDDFLEIRNAWGNFAIRDLVQVRVGKMYRKFGLYNERLDQIPTFIGIEAPEMFDTDHLFLDRTTSLMVHGQHQNQNRKISYALMTDNGENGPVKNLIPVGWDLRMKSFTKSFIIGASGYFSSMNNTATTSARALGAGSPTGGILPWMQGDRFNVIGVFMEKQIGNLLFQTEYYKASHEAERNADAMLTVIKEGNINKTQRQRFLGTNSEKNNDQLTASDIVTKTNYAVQTFYVRMGYNVQSELGQFVPYLMLDWMSNPEVIQNKKFGGDEEAGLADDGKFLKPSAGLVFRPVSNVAIKLDGSYHMQKFNGEKVMYPEIRLDFSFAFSNHLIQKAIGD